MEGLSVGLLLLMRPCPHPSQQRGGARENGRLVTADRWLS